MSTRDNQAWVDRARWSLPHDVQEAVRNVPDATLEELITIAGELEDRFSDKKDYTTVNFVEVALRLTVDIEQDRRKLDRERARVLLEANGHEITVGQDDDEPTWYAECTCGSPLGRIWETQDEAREEADNHAKVQGGKVLTPVTA